MNIKRRHKSRVSHTSAAPVSKPKTRHFLLKFGELVYTLDATSTGLKTKTEGCLFCRPPCTYSTAVIFGEGILLENQHEHAGTKSYLDTACWADGPNNSKLNVETTSDHIRIGGLTSTWKLEDLNGKEIPLSFGDQARLLNQYNSVNWYLKAEEWVVASKTLTEQSRENFIWTISSAEGKSGEVHVGDKVQFQAQSSNGSLMFLDTRGMASCRTTPPGGLEVRLSASNDRSRGSGTWKIHAA